MTDFFPCVVNQCAQSYGEDWQTDGDTEMIERVRA